MTGDILYPLNVLKDKYPEIYEKHKRKYKDREEIMDLVIHGLNCLWNDALHLSAINPRIVKDELSKAGGRSDYKMFYYQIDPHALNPDNTVVYLYSTPELDMKKKEDFIKFNPDEMGKYSFLPKETTNHYEESYRNKRRPLPFHRAPHILYKGSVNIKDCLIIEV